MSRLFTKQSFTRAWNPDFHRECIIAREYFSDAVDGDVLRVWTNRGKNAVAIIWNGAVEQIYANRCVTFSRKYTDRYRNALQHFESIIAELREDNFNVAILVHPTDEGLVNFVNPVDMRMDHYGLKYNANGQWLILCQPGPQIHYDVDDDSIDNSDCCPMSIFVDRCSDDENSSLDYNNRFEEPNVAANVIGTVLPTLLKTQTELIRVYDGTPRVRNYAPRCGASVEKSYSARREIVGHNGEIFVVKPGDYIFRTEGNSQWIQASAKRWNRICGKSFKFETTAGSNRYFSIRRRGIYQPTLRCCIESRPSYTFERILDTSIALSILDLPVYVILWILDFLPGTQFATHIKKLRYIEAIQKSIRNIRESRARKLNCIKA